MTSLFLYGTLMNDEVVRLVTGASVATIPVRLIGYQRVTVRGQVYPAIYPDVNGVVDGNLTEHLSPAQLRRIDQYEGEYYQRVAVNVSTACKYPKQLTTHL